MGKKAVVLLKRSWIILFSIVGVGFSGFLSFTNFFLGFCPLIEGCPLILGVPACLYGLGFFVALLALALLDKRSVVYVALAGVAFSVYSTFIELLIPGLSYSLGLPSCVYGLVLYLIILFLGRQ